MGQIYLLSAITISSIDVTLLMAFVLNSFAHSATSECRTRWTIGIFPGETKSLTRMS
jgi:hypothetical protein